MSSLPVIPVSRRLYRGLPGCAMSTLTFDPMMHRVLTRSSLTRPFPSSPSSTSSADIPTLQNRLSTLSDLHKSTTDKLASATLELEQLRVRFNETVAQAHAANQELTKRWQDADRELRWAKEGRAGAEQRERLYRDELDVLRDGAVRRFTYPIVLGIDNRAGQILLLSADLDCTDEVSADRP